jgi:alginate O-acetyltransferase complex protein AlgI
MLSEGADHIVFGLAKVVLSGHALHLMMLAGLDLDEMTLFGCWLGMAAFFGQAYFTLSGLCEMSMGMGLLNGFTYKRNFDDIDSRGLFTGLVKGYNTSVTGFFREAIYEPFKEKKLLGGLAAFITCMAVAAWYSFSKPSFIAGAAVGAVIILEMIVGDKLRKLPAVVRYIYMAVLSMVIFGGLYFGSVYGWRKWAFGLIGVGDKYLLSVQTKQVLLSNLFIYIISLIYFLPPLRNFVTKALTKLQGRSKGFYTGIEVTKSVIKALMLIMCIAAITVGKMR